MSEQTIEQLAARLAERLEESIPLSKTREEHIRVTARANEAAELLNVIRSQTASTPDVIQLDLPNG
jgi:hypothetical protein